MNYKIKKKLRDDNKKLRKSINLMKSKKKSKK